MACTKNLRTDLLDSTADTGGTWTYNGYRTFGNYDGDKENTGQFSPGDTPASPPEELPSAGATMSGDDPSVDLDGHTAGVYSFSYEVTGGSCTDTENVVLPLFDAPDAGEDTIINLCTTDASINLYTQWGIDGTNAPNASTSGVGWHSGTGLALLGGAYNNNSTVNDITDDTFDPSIAGVGTYIFVYLEEVDMSALSGFDASDCIDCTDRATVTVIVTQEPNAGSASNAAYCN